MNFLKQDKGLAFKLILYIFTSIGIIFSVIFLYNYKISKGIVEKNLKLNAKNLTIASVLKVDKVLSTVQKIPDNFAKIIVASDLSKSNIIEILRLEVENNPEIYGAAIAFEPNYFEAGQNYFCPYFYRNKGKIDFKYIGGANYDYYTMDWYQIPKLLNKSIWSEPYYDEGAGNALMSTYSVPLYKTVQGRKVFIGILTADISLDWLQEFMNSIKVLKTGYGYVVSTNGTIVTHPVKSMVMNETIFSIADAQKSPELREIGRNMIHGKSSFAEFAYRNVKTHKLSWIAYTPIPLNNWSIGIVFPVDEFMADVNNLYTNLVFLGLIGLVFVLLVIVFISRSITSPLRGLTLAAGKFAGGDFNVQLPKVKSKDEISKLNTSFIYMQNALAATINDLRDASDKLKISNEKLEDYNRTLEQKVDERAAELKAAQVQLVQSEKMASLGQLTAGIAHEIKNPLNFVNNFAELTVELADELAEEIEKISDTLSAKDKEYFLEMTGDIRSNAQKINDHGKRADSIIRGMLLHSRGKAGDMQPTDINAVLAEYISLGYHGMRAQDQAFNLKIETNYDKTIGSIKAVPQNISRVFLNIINNACYSTNQKSKDLKEAYFPVLSVQTLNLEKVVEIRIRDNGKGIPQEILDKVFNPFFTTKPAGQGTGLGLSLSFDIIVQEHHGEMKVESKEGEFAEFIIRIPKDLK